MNFLLALFLFPFVASQILPDVSNQKQKVEDVKLVRLDPVSVGHERMLQLKTGKTLTIKTIAVNPPLFEIENFLADDECDYMKQLAEKSMWQESITVPPEAFRTGKSEVGNHRLNFKTADRNNDNYVDFLEFWYVRPPIQNAMITVDDIPEFIQLYNYDVDGDKKLNVDEFNMIDVKLVYEWMYMKMETDKRKNGRISNQVWVAHESDNFLRELKERVVLLSGLPKRIIDASETMQIVNYEVGGHYHGHYDSQTINNIQACIHTREIDGISGHAELDYKTYRLCRYATIMYYLNDVEEGGETAFPVADNETISEKVIFAGGDIGDLSNHCKDARLVVKPKKGKAVMWYNHLLNNDGWMGERDSYSFHGGCDIIKGVKWIANHWLTVDTNKERQLRYMDLWKKKHSAQQKQEEMQRLQQQEQQQTNQQEQNQQNPQLPNFEQEESVNIRLPQKEIVNQRHKELLNKQLEKEELEKQKQQEEIFKQRQKEFQNLRRQEENERQERFKKQQIELERVREETQGNNLNIKDEL